MAGYPFSRSCNRGYDPFSGFYGDLQQARCTGLMLGSNLMMYSHDPFPLVSNALGNATHPGIYSMFL